MVKYSRKWRTRLDIKTLYNSSVHLDIEFPVILLYCKDTRETDRLPRGVDKLISKQLSAIAVELKKYILGQLNHVR